MASKKWSRAGFHRLRRRSLRRGWDTLPSPSPWAMGSKSFAAYWYQGVPNMGDALSPLILEHFLERRARWAEPHVRGKIVSTGSIVTGAKPGDLVVGSGLQTDTPWTLPGGAKVLALRGPLTHDRIRNAPSTVAYGDPGLLAPEVLGISPPETLVGPIALIPHYVDKVLVANQLQKRSDANDLRVIDVQQSPHHVLSELTRCRACVSTSLHGVIVSEALGIPTWWAEVSDEVVGGGFKFGDYYLGTNREPRAALRLDEALERVADPVSERFFPDKEPIRHALQLTRDFVAGSGPPDLEQ